MKYANQLGYSDINPYEVVRVVSDKCLEVRAMAAERNPEWKPEFVPGGFSAVCLNQNSQEWDINSDPNARAIRIRLRKNGQWYAASGARYALGDEPVKFYDYNF